MDPSHCSYDSRCAGLYHAIHVFVAAAAAALVGRSSAAQHCGLLPRGEMLIHIARKAYSYTNSRYQEQLYGGEKHERPTCLYSLHLAA